jgi:hypothetical protein
MCSSHAATVRRIAMLIERAIAAERRACLEIVEEFAAKSEGGIAAEIAAEIRERGKQEEHFPSTDRGAKSVSLHGSDSQWWLSY